MSNNISKTKEQLLAELDHLREKSKKKETALEAANQQLEAVNQQLEANKQQLQASEASVRKKLIAITEPAGDVSNLELSDLLDADKLQSLMDDLNNITGMCCGIADLKGNILASVGWREICKNFHRVHPTCQQKCRESDTTLSSGIAPGEFKLYRCENNMWEAASPITIGGKHMGNVFFGQFFYDDEKVDVGIFRGQARLYGFDEQNYLSALNKVPRYSRKTIAHSLRFVANFAELISAQSYSNLVLSRTLIEQKEAEEKLQSTNHQLEATNQQFEAANQQLEATNQQLEAANQQLEASEHELKKQRDLLLETQRVAHISDWTFDPKTGMPWWSEELYKIYDLDPTNGPLSYEDHPKLIHPDDWDWFDATVQEAAKTGKPYDIVLRIIRTDGGIRYINSICKPIVDESGHVIQMRGTIQDVTEREEAKEIVLQSKLRFQSLFDNSPLPLWEEDFSEVKKYINSLKSKNPTELKKHFIEDAGEVKKCANLVKVIDFNNAVLAMHETSSKDELIGGLAHIFSDASLDGFIKELIAIIEGKLECEFSSTVKTLNGVEKDIFLKWQVVPGYEETLERVYISTIDISEQKRAEEKTKDSLNLLTSFIDNFPEDVWAKDKDGGMILANACVKRNVFGGDDFIGKTVYDFFPRKWLMNTGPQKKRSLKKIRVSKQKSRYRRPMVASKQKS